MLIYQDENGDDNTGKSPLGGVLVQGSASSIMTTIANPITSYGNPVINQAGHSSDLYDYYWTSYSRGTDGTYPSKPLWHNAYLDGYIPLRVKSIYDPCPYLYRIPSNGTFNQFTSNPGWTEYSYSGGVSCATTLEESWMTGSGWRDGGSSVFYGAGRSGFSRFSTASSQVSGYQLELWSGKSLYPNRNDVARAHGVPVRCIEVTRRYAHTFCQQKVCKNCRAS